MSVFFVFGEFYLQAEFIQHLVHFGQFVFMEVAELYAFLCVVVNLSGTAAGKIGNEIADLREVVGILSHLTSRCKNARKYSPAPRPW